MNPPSAREPWPEADLEYLARCPVCGLHDRVLLHESLVDSVFGVADGYWTLYRCIGCDSGYLDPRPTPQSIGRAYAGYYTHSAVDHPLVRRKGTLRTLLHDAVHGYQNRRYGLHRQPASKMLGRLLPCFPSLRGAADAECRHLPAKAGRLLDVGCGSGHFLELAAQAGWAVEGVDFDPGAVEAARSRGLQVQLGGVEVLDGREACFDVITLCHVIEHLHDPGQVVRALHRLLKPGGTLWLDTPNLGSLGYEHYGRHWRDLDPPRHLVLFGRETLFDLLRQSGFEQIRQRWRGLTVFEVFAASDAISRAAVSWGSSYDSRPPWRAILAELREMMQPSRREFLTVTARKP